ncbi:hypothetical protein ACFX12_026690 [Malus domestica]
MSNLQLKASCHNLQQTHITICDYPRRPSYHPPLRFPQIPPAPTLPPSHSPTPVVIGYPQCSCASRLVTNNDLHLLQLLDLPLNLYLRHHQFSSVAIPRKSRFVGEAMTEAVGEDPLGDPI